MGTRPLTLHDPAAARTAALLVGIFQSCLELLMFQLPKA